MYWVKVVVSWVLVTVIVWQSGDLGAIGALLGRIDPVYVALVLVLYTADRALVTYKWLRLMAAIGIGATEVVAIAGRVLQIRPARALNWNRTAERTLDVLDTVLTGTRR